MEQTPHSHNLSSTINMKQITAIGTFFGLLPLCLAQFPATPTGLTVTDSKVNNQVKISYKKVRDQAGGT